MHQPELFPTVDMAAREAAKSLIATYVKRGDSVEEIRDSQMGHCCHDYWAAVGDYVNGKRISSDHIVVSALNGVHLDTPQVFKLEEIFDEIRGGRDE